MIPSTEPARSTAHDAVHYSARPNFRTGPKADQTPASWPGADSTPPSRPSPDPPPRSMVGGDGHGIACTASHRRARTAQPHDPPSSLMPALRPHRVHRTAGAVRHGLLGFSGGPTTSWPVR